MLSFSAEGNYMPCQRQVKILLEAWNLYVSTDTCLVLEVYFIVPEQHNFASVSFFLQKSNIFRQIY